MKFTVLSDLHLDFHIRHYEPNILLRKRFENVLDARKDVPILIVAGDISHRVDDIKIIERLVKLFNYEKAYCVLGNHDIYLTSTVEQDIYKCDSKNKAINWYARQTDRVRILNGSSELFEGTKISGAMGWYGGSYLNPHAALSIMSDIRYIYGYENIMDIYGEEYDKLLGILDTDIMITHVCPSVKQEAIQEHFRSSPHNCLFTFDGDALLERTTAKYWVYGHSHGTHEFTEHNTKCIMNTLGYPGEHSHTIMTKEL